MKFLLLSLLLFSTSVLANERVLPASQLIAEGYRPSSAPLMQGDQLPPAHSLPWPAPFQDNAHSLANSMAEFQPFGDPYFHGGCDLRTHSGAELHAPVSGKLEAGHYSYVTNSNGSMTKYWKPWPQQGDAYYFEVAVIDENGNRFELHHVDRRTLPVEIVQQLNRGGTSVSAGTLLGHVIRWPDGEYHHTHYNIVLPSGIRVNPEFVSPLLPDHLAPEILGTFALSSAGLVSEFGSGMFVSAPKEFVIDVLDKQNENIYEHPPSFARLRFSSGEETVWDFRITLTKADGSFPPLWDFFLESLRGPNGDYLYTEGGYGTGHSLVRLAVPAGASGPFTIEMGDIAGNIRQLSGTIVQ